MIELHISDDGHLRQVMEELRPLVPVGGVVFVPFEHEGFPRRPEAEAAFEAEGHPADQEPRLAPRPAQNPGEERGRGGLAVGPGDHHRDPGPQHELPKRLREGEEGQPAVECGFEFRIPARHRISDHHRPAAVGQIGRRERRPDGDSLPFEKGGHRRVGALVGPGHGVAEPGQEPGERGHRGPRHPEQVQPVARPQPVDHRTAPSSRVRPSSSIRARTSNGMVRQRDPTVWPVAKPIAVGTPNGSVRRHRSSSSV